jgi:hypothetical protein
VHPTEPSDAAEEAPDHSRDDPSPSDDVRDPQHDSSQEPGSERQDGPGDGMQMSYLRFAAMIATSMVAMYVLTYVNTYELSHVRWSETRFFMVFVMGSTMAVIMLAYMLSMYSNPRINAGIVAGSVVVFVLALWLVRSQTTVQDQSYMRAMIPHHSIAILTSERAEISDLRVQELAREIIEAQRREIAEMEWLIDDIEDNGAASTPTEAEARPVPDFSADG